VKGSQGGVSTAGDKLLKSALFLLFLNLLSFHYKRHNQSKVDGRSTVKKNRDLLNLLVQT